MSVGGIASRSAQAVTRQGRRSPDTIDLGFLKARSLPATWNGSSIGNDFEWVMGISAVSNGENSSLIALKWSARASAISWSVFSGVSSLTSNYFGFSPVCIFEEVSIGIFGQQDVPLSQHVSFLSLIHI